MTGGIDLSVGATAACASVVAALLSPYGLLPGLLGGARRGPRRSALLNGFMVTRMQHPAVHRHAVGHADRERRGAAAGAQPVRLGVLRHRLHLARAGRLARLSRCRPGSPRAPMSTARCCSTSPLRPPRARGRRQRGGGAADGSAGRPGRSSGPMCSRACSPGWPASSSRRSSAPASRPKASAGSCSRSPPWSSAARCSPAAWARSATTLAGVLLLGLIFNVLNFENGLGWISLSAYWQSVVRGVFLMVVVMAGSGAPGAFCAPPSCAGLLPPAGADDSLGDRQATARMCRRAGCRPLPGTKELTPGTANVDNCRGRNARGSGSISGVRAVVRRNGARL